MELDVDMDTNIQNIVCAITNTSASFEAQFIKKLSNTETECKKMHCL